MRTTSHLLQALLDATRIAFPLECVDRVLRAVRVHEVPGGTHCLLGAVDVAGELVCLYDTRRLLGMSTQAARVRADDRMVLMRGPVRCALLVDDVLGTVAAGPIELTGEFGLHAAGLRGVARADDGVLLVHDVRRLLALERAVPIATDG